MFILISHTTDVHTHLPRTYSFTLWSVAIQTQKQALSGLNIFKLLFLKQFFKMRSIISGELLRLHQNSSKFQSCQCKRCAPRTKILFHWVKMLTAACAFSTHILLATAKYPSLKPASILELANSGIFLRRYMENTFLLLSPLLSLREWGHVCLINIGWSICLWGALSLSLPH